AADDLFFQLVLGGDFGLLEEIAVLVQQCWQLVAAQAAAVEHGQRIAALVGQVLDQDEGEQRQALGGLVHLRAHLLGHEVIEAAWVTDQLEAQRLEQRAVLVLQVGQLRVGLRFAARKVIALEQLAEDRRQLGHFLEVDVHKRGSQAIVGWKTPEAFPPESSVLAKVDKLRVVHPTSGLAANVGWKTAKHFPPASLGDRVGSTICIGHQRKGTEADAVFAGQVLAAL